MKKKNLLVVFIVLALIFSLSACGGKDNSSPESLALSEADQQAAADKLAAEAEKIPEPDTKSSSTANIDNLLGEWNDVSDSTRFVKVTKEGDLYKYEDNDGSYSGTAKDGVLTIQISDAANDTAMVFMDPETKNLVTNYQGDIYEYSKKLSD